MEKYIKLAECRTTFEKKGDLKGYFDVSVRFFMENEKEIKLFTDKKLMSFATIRYNNEKTHSRCLIKVPGFPPEEVKMPEKFGGYVIDYSDKKEYTFSKPYAKIKRAYYKKYEKICAICDLYDPGKMNLHHVTYERLGMEILETDLVCLCQQCHSELHANIAWDNSRIGETTFLLSNRKLVNKSAEISAVTTS